MEEGEEPTRPLLAAHATSVCAPCARRAGRGAVARCGDHPAGRAWRPATTTRCTLIFADIMVYVGRERVEMARGPAPVGFAGGRPLLVHSPGVSVPRVSEPAGRPPTAAPCPCGRWIWYELVLAPGLALHERTCPRCRKRSLLLFRSGRFEAAVRLTGRDLRGIRAAIARMRLSETDRAALLRVAELLVEAA